MQARIEIRAENNPHPAGFVNFTAIVSPPDATGTVYWFVDQACVTSNGLTDGLVPLSNLNIASPGDHLITAVYGGDSKYEPASAVVKQTAI